MFVGSSSVLTLAQQIGRAAIDDRVGPATPWGDHSLVLRFAGLRFVLNGLTGDQRQALSRRYVCESPDADLGSHSEQTIETQICRVPNLCEDPDAYTTAGFYTPRVTRVEDHLRIEGFGLLADVTLTPSLTARLSAADGDLLTLPLVIENYLRIVAAYASLMKGGLLLHSAGVVADGEAYLFLGRSGAGKTTLSSLALASGAGVLSDDINIVLPSARGSFIASAVPFAGELGNSCAVREGDYPLRGVFCLKKGGRSVEGAPLSFCDQLAKVYACCPVVNADARQMDRILDVAASVLTAAPMRILSFDRAEAFSSILERIRTSQNAGE